jgi:RNA polymerase sigma-70 factor (ECF subfamily)
VSDEIYNAMIGWKREDEAYLRRLYRNKAHYSLDRIDQFEYKPTVSNPTPYEIITEQSVKKQLYAAVASLPGKQVERLYAYFFLDMKKSDIAKAENSSQQTVSQMIQRSLLVLKEMLKDSYADLL